MTDRERRKREEIKGELTENPIVRYPDTNPDNVKKTLEKLG